MDGRHGRRLFLPVPDADVVPRPASAGRSRSGDVPRLQSLALRAHPRGRAAHRLDAVSSVQRPRRRLQDRQGFRRQEGRGRIHGDVAALQAGARQRLRQDLRAARRDGQAHRLPCGLQLARPVAVADQSVHLRGFMWFNMVHMTNWVINGLPERFPKLKVMWIESVLTWAYCLMQRLDHSYMMRTSDCPSLKRRPSEYMREMYYSSQPMEKPRDRSILEATFKMINAETQLMWSSDYPHWDFDLPSVIYDLPFLSETGRRNILGGTAAKVFGLAPKPVKKIP